MAVPQQGTTQQHEPKVDDEREHLHDVIDYLNLPENVNRRAQTRREMVSARKRRSTLLEN